MYIEKLHGVAEENLGKWLIPSDQRDIITGQASAYITDGDRVWWWSSFPYPGALERGGLARFAQFRTIQWLTEERPPLLAVGEQPPTDEDTDTLWGVC